MIHLFSALIPRQSILDATQPIWAVELSHVTQIGRVEADPQVFLGDLTYPTKELCAVLRMLRDRFAKPQENPGTVLLRAPYGHGKSHLLVTLYHCLNTSNAESLAATKTWFARYSTQGGFAFDYPSSLAVIPHLFMERNVQSIWDEILLPKLGRTDLCGVPVDTTRIAEAIGNRKVVLLLDELEAWFGERDETDPISQKNLNFLQAATMFAAESDRLTLVVSLLGLRGPNTRLESVLRRYNPPERSFQSGDDRIEIVLHRLFEGRDQYDPASSASGVIRAYLDALTRAGVTGLRDYEANLLRTFPFAPDLLDLVLNRFPQGFQKLRHGLEFLT